MKIFEADITLSIADYFRNNLNKSIELETVNCNLQILCGIKSFFSNGSELNEIIYSIENQYSILSEPDRTEYGDFQTNSELANEITFRLNEIKFEPEIIIEPTCGKGNFVIASLTHFKNVNHIIGIEIYKPYIWKTKFSILDFFLNNPDKRRPEIDIIHGNVFDFDFDKLLRRLKSNNILIIGNPPWVTNAQLGSLNSVNLPKKVNVKNQNGLDAMTGKGNFDIAEYIILSLLDTFQNTNGYLALLLKNSVIKNIIFDQKSKQYRIGNIEKYSIDSKKEFNVSVDSSLFLCRLNTNPEFKCSEYNFYDKQFSLDFGWLGNKFVSNINNYSATNSIDGTCPYVWRQGIKHDAASVMELERKNGHFQNGLKEDVLIEEGLLFGFLKSSDLKNTVILETRKFTIVTQTKVGQDTNFIKAQFPETYNYLSKHSDVFESRKSSIYNGKPLFSIFGIGNYSFKPYKVAISGLYKTFHFTLVLPQNNKPVMLDDTCYFIGFDIIEFAVYSLIILNSQQAEAFLKSITFPDAKRVFTKDVLMRIDMLELARGFSKYYIEGQLEFINNKFDLNIDLKYWDKFIEEMKPKETELISLF